MTLGDYNLTRQPLLSDLLHPTRDSLETNNGLLFYVIVRKSKLEPSFLSARQI